MYVTTHVGNEMRQYVLWTYKSDIIPLERDSVLLDIIKPHLETKPASSVDDFDEEETVRIELPNINGKVYYGKGKRLYVCNTLWRDVLDNQGHKKVQRFLERNFKKSFRCFMDGYTEAQYIHKKENERMKVKSGAVAFLMQYHIDVNEKTVNRLVRDWFRHRDRNEENKTAPFVL